MGFPSYTVHRHKGTLLFYFESNNIELNNPITKVVSYQMVVKYGKPYYNLALGDYDSKTNEVDDRAISNNGDMRKVLATTIVTLEVFFQEHPDKTVHISGNDRTRNEYYRKLINDYSQLILDRYFIQGCYHGAVESFQWGRDYEFILISKLQ